MSDPATKIERSKAKDIRQGIVDQRSHIHACPKKRRQKPYAVMHKMFKSDRWYRYARFRTKEEAQAYIDKCMRSFYSQIPGFRHTFRIDSDL